MAFNNTSYYPQYYQNYQNPYMTQSQIQQSQMPQQNQQIQNGGFIPVPSEEFARNYPVAPGNSVTFKNESMPYVYTKTMGFSQLDRPIFEKYKLVKENSEEDSSDTSNPILESIDEIKSELGKIKSDMNDIRDDTDKVWDEVNALKRKPTTKRKEDVGD